LRRPTRTRTTPRASATSNKNNPSNIHNKNNPAGGQQAHRFRGKFLLQRALLLYKQAALYEALALLLEASINV
jgi:hypothetical protein